MHVAEPRQCWRAGIVRRLAEQRRQIGVGLNLTGTNECRRLGEPRRFFLVSPDGCDRRQLVERLV